MTKYAIVYYAAIDFADNSEAFSDRLCEWVLDL